MLGLVQTKIQHGVSTASGTITIDEVSNVDACIVITTASCTAYLTSTTELSVSAATAWYVIELGGAVVE